MKLKVWHFAMTACVLALTAGAQPILDVLPSAENLGAGWKQEITFLFDSASKPPEIVRTLTPPTDDWIKDRRRNNENPDGNVSGWCHLEYELNAPTGPSYTVQVERYRNHEQLTKFFPGFLASLQTNFAKTVIKDVGDEAVYIRQKDGTGSTIWFRRGDFLVSISPFTSELTWDEDTALRHLAAAIDRRMTSQSIHTKSSVISPNKSRIVVLAGPTIIPISPDDGTNSITVSFSRWGGDKPDTHAVALFSLTNTDSRQILLWNVRVQIPATNSTGGITNWETVHDDYPAGAGSSLIGPGKLGEFQVKSPERSPWRVCILYSKEIVGSPTKSWSGNYESIGPETSE